jgi:hypothetical protein
MAGEQQLAEARGGGTEERVKIVGLAGGGFGGFGYFAVFADEGD